LNDGFSRNRETTTMNARISKLQNEKALFMTYADQARFAGAFDVELDWLTDAAKLQAQIDQMLNEIAEEGRIARMTRIADIASGRYRVTAR
jgi:hypothetical protein